MTDTFNLAAALLDPNLAAGRGGRPALRYEGDTLTYAELADLVARTGAGLRRLGVDIEQRVALLLPDAPQFVAAFLGAMRIGAVPVTLSTLLSVDDYAYLLDDCRASALVVHASVRSKIDPLRARLPRLRHVVVTGAPPQGGDIAFSDLWNAPASELPPVETTRDDLAFFQYSSGTTGRPKGVVHLHGSAHAPADLHGRLVAEITADDRILSLPKLFFSFGLNNSCVVPLRHGASAILLPDRPDPRLVLDTIARERPTLLYHVPTGYAAILAAVEAGVPADLSSVRRCISAGEALPAPIFERWKARFGLEILDGIGSTEIGYICISNTAGDVRPGTSGRVIPGYDAVVQREDGTPAKAGEVGVLLVRGPSTAAHYWRKRDATKHTFRGEWVFTGDRYTVDADGYFTYQGRSDDMIRVSGLWVSPLEVESALLRHPKVRECAVVARADGEGLIHPCAFVVATDGAGAALSSELLRFASDALSAYKRPKWIEFTDELPKTSTGKVQRYKLRAK
ncbi:MAG TPA: benzoate-CoA ligase family protein [Candidatus Acidoferrales bacterium]|nr:benzoate-CoA ligase family protein [Candidatus Acidoferrales bacterium]